MALSLNKVMIIGNLGRDPEMRYSPSGAANCTFSVATSRSWKNKDSDEWQEETEWHNVVIWGNAAERAAEQLRKGKKVYVEGRLKTRTWDDEKNPGVKHYRTEIVADVFINLDPKGVASGGDEQGQFEAPSGGFSAKAPARTQQHDPLDDLPF